MAPLLPFDGQKEKKPRGGKRARGDGGLSAPGALDLMRQTGDADGVFTVASRSELARILKWERTRTSKALDRWAATGAIVLDDDTPGKILIRVMPDQGVASDGKGSATSRVKAPGKQRPATRDIVRPSRREHAPPTVREITPPEHRETSPETLLTPTTTTGINKPAEDPGRPAVTAPPPTPPAIHAAPHRDVPVSIDASLPVAAAESAPVPGGQLSQCESRYPERPDGTGRAPATEGRERSAPGGGGNTITDVVDDAGELGWLRWLAVAVAVALSAYAAYMAVGGLVVVYVAEPAAIMVGAAIFEVTKFVGVAFLASAWREKSLVLSVALGVLVAVVEVLNCAGVFNRLQADHWGDASARTAAYLIRDAEVRARIEVANARLDDVTRQINQIDEAVTAAIRRGRAGGSMTLTEHERRNRTALVAERDRLQQQVSDRTAERAALSARQRLADSERMPIQYTEKLLEDVGLLPRGTDPEVVVRWISLGFLLACDPLALALTMFAASHRGRPRRAR